MSHSAFEITDQWKQGETEFPVQSSGSTGIPKTILLKRRLIILSCNKTAEALSVTKADSILCCLPIDKVGGMMQIFRSLVWDIPIEITTPSGNPLINYTGKASIISLTPMQLGNILSDKQQRESLTAFRIVLLGGGSLNDEMERKLTEIKGPAFFHTYGMTETYSHVALKKTGRDKAFRFIYPTEFSLNDNRCLKFKNEITENEWLQTNDLASINADGTFNLLGRFDDVVNSGGIKINPRDVESIISEQTGLDENDFFCAGLPDSLLGELLVLILRQGITPPDLEKIQFNPAYLKPRKIFGCKEFQYTDTGKLRRKATLELSGNLQELR